MSTFINIEDKAQEEVYDVIIVGAGVSGLQTAQTLINTHNIPVEKVLLLEAQDYIGGRVRQTTDFVKHVKVELGAEILHGKNTALTRFAEEVGQPIDQIFTWAHGDGGPLDFPVNGGYGLYYIGKGDASPTGRLLRFDAQDEDFKKMNDEIHNLAHVDPKTLTDAESLKQFLEQKGHSKEMIGMADAGFANTLCIEIADLSCKQSVQWSHMWHEETKDEGDYKFRNSFACLVDHLKTGLNVLTQKVVKSVTMQDASEEVPRVSIQCEDGSVYRSHAVVVTSSLHVLRSKQIEFSPPLGEEKEKALECMIMRPAAKVFVKFSELCWPADVQGMIISDPDMLFPEIWFRDVRNIRADGETAAGYATGFATSLWAERIASMPEEEVYKTMCAQLEKIFSHLENKHMKASEADSAETAVDDVPAIVFPPKASDVFISGHMQQWNENNRFVGGGFCAPRAGYPTNSVEVLVQPVMGALFLAGEAMMQPAGTAHAAMEAGMRAASQVKEALVERNLIAPDVAESK